MNERYCILRVDDDVSGLEVRAVLLEEEGYSVTAVSCPLMALEFVATKLHLVVLDFAMAALSELQLVLCLRATLASFPIVLLSGMSREVPNDMRRVFTRCRDKGKPMPILLNTKCSKLVPIPEPPECQAMSRDCHPLYRGYRP